MKSLYKIKGAFAAIAVFALSAGVTSCGDKFLETDMFNAVDENEALTDLTRVGTALNGTYYQFHRYYFAGNYAYTIGDIASDLPYWNGKTSHWFDLYSFGVRDTDTYLSYIWEYGYKVIDESNRIIDAAEELKKSASEEDIAQYDEYLAEAYALRGYSRLMLVNIFAHQVKVNGTDYSAQPGIVIEDHAVGVSQTVSRATVGKSYEAIVGDFTKSLQYFNQAGFSNPGIFTMNPAAVHGLLARTYLYLENFDAAAASAQDALDEAGISSLEYSPEGYASLYYGGASNSESFFALAIDDQTNWSANSCGTLWSSYSYSPGPWLQSIMAADDCRRAVWTWGATSTPETPIFGGGKFGVVASGNPASATNYIVNAPEMFLIKAEALTRGNKSVSDAQNALLTVAKRNPAIASAADLPSDRAALLSFIQDERARELFQEGLRLYDLRRWDKKVNVFATEAPAIKWLVNNYQISRLVLPIPVDEINTHSGVTQNEGWSSTLPQ